MRYRDWILGVVVALGIPGAMNAQALRGKVIVEGEGPAKDVDVRLITDSAGWLLGTAAITRTDSFGDFLVVAASRGMFALEVKRVGIVPLRTSSFQLNPGDTAELMVRTVRLATSIEGVKVVGENGHVVDFTRGFEERQKRLKGTFLDRTEIERRSGARTFDILHAIPGLRVIADDTRPGMNEQRLVSDRGGRSFSGGLCMIATFVDGVEYDQLELSRSMRPSDFEAIEFYSAAETPVQYKRMNAICGTLLVWTRATTNGRKKKDG